MHDIWKKKLAYLFALPITINVTLEGKNEPLTHGRFKNARLTEWTQINLDVTLRLIAIMWEGTHGRVQHNLNCSNTALYLPTSA